MLPYPYIKLVLPAFRRDLVPLCRLLCSLEGREHGASGGITNTAVQEVLGAPGCYVLQSAYVMMNSLTSVQGVLELGACVPNMEAFLVDGVI